METLVKRGIGEEIKYKASPSSGPGGQHVNKVSTRMEAFISIPASKVLTAEEQKTLLKKLKTKLDKDGVLKVMDQTSRSQSSNKARAFRKLIDLLEKGLKKKKKRIPTKISAEKKKARLRAKRTRSLTKKLRGAVKREDF